MSATLKFGILLWICVWDLTNGVMFQYKALNQVALCQGCSVWETLYIQYDLHGCSEMCAERRYCYYYRYASDKCLMGIPGDFTAFDNQIQLSEIPIAAHEEVYEKQIRREMVSSYATWQNAINACAGMAVGNEQGTTATIYFSEELDLIKTQIGVQAPNAWLWTNGYKNGNNWYWSPCCFMDTSLFSPGQPDGDGTCVNTFAYASHQMLLNDFPCTGELHYICEFI